MTDETAVAEADRRSGTARRLIAFATDQTYAPLARGLVLSLVDAGFPGPDTDIAMVDIGCAPETLDWFRAKGVRVGTFDPSGAYGFAGRMALPRYATAQICRPHLPAIFPGYDILAWLDADMWVQDAVGIEAYFEAVGTSARVAAVPWLDASYRHHFRGSAAAFDMINVNYERTYGEAVVHAFRGKPMLSSGGFAARADSPFWRRWHDEIEKLFGAAAAEQKGFGHLVEQTAFNYVLLSDNLLIALDAAHNYHCHTGNACRRDDGSVAIGVPPYCPIHIVHLSETRGYMARYLEQGLLYRSGAYLDDAERAALERVRRR
jgi:hypothetical protein